MASFLDIGILQQANVVFAFVLVWALTYSVMSFTKIMDMERNTRALVSVLIALLTLLIPQILDVVAVIVPWFALAFVFIVFILIALMALGLTKADITKGLSNEFPGNTIKYSTVVIAFIILAAGLGSVFFSADSDNGAVLTAEDGSVQVQATGDVGGQGQSALLATLFHPRVLGFIFVMLIAVFAMIQIAR